MIWTDNMMIPKGAAHKYTAELMIDYSTTRPWRGPDRRRRLLHLAGQGRRRARSRRSIPRRRQPAVFPPPDVLAKRLHSFGPGRGGRAALQRAVRRPDRRLTDRRRDRRPPQDERSGWAPGSSAIAGSSRTLLLLPGILWLRSSSCSRVSRCSSTSLLDGDAEQGFTFYVRRLQQLHRGARPSSRSSRPLDRLRRRWRRCSTFLIGYPLAYAHRVQGGRYKNLLLFLVIAPFFTSFLLRTISWKIILGNDGPAARPAQGPRRRARGLPAPGHADRRGLRASPTTSCRS